MLQQRQSQSLSPPGPSDTQRSDPAHFNLIAGFWPAQRKACNLFPVQGYKPQFRIEIGIALNEVLPASELLLEGGFDKTPMVPECITHRFDHCALLPAGLHRANSETFRPNRKLRLAVKFKHHAQGMPLEVETLTSQQFHGIGLAAQ